MRRRARHATSLLNLHRRKENLRLSRTPRAKATRFQPGRVLRNRLSAMLSTSLTKSISTGERKTSVFIEKDARKGNLGHAESTNLTMFYIAVPMPSDALQNSRQSAFRHRFVCNMYIMFCIRIGKRFFALIRVAKTCVHILPV